MSANVIEFPINRNGRSKQAAREFGGMTLSATPLRDPAEILKRMPASAISPALFRLIESMSRPLRLVEPGPAADVIELTTSRPRLMKAA